MTRERLTAEELRNVERGTHLVVKLDDEYWSQGEGTVLYVTEYDGGSVHVGIKGLTGHENRLKIPADAREGMTFDGAARGASGLSVDYVVER